MDPFKPYVPRARQAFSSDDAQALALQVLAWIVGDDEMRDRFVAVTGCGGDDMRARLAQPGFLGAVLDFLLADEGSVLAFAEQAGIAPDLALRARALLP